MSDKPGASAQKKVIVFLILAFGFSSIFYYLTAVATSEGNTAALGNYITLLMWCPALAAIITYLYFDRNLRGIGLGAGDPKWLLFSVLIPILLGLVMFGYVWLNGTGPFNFTSAAQIFTLAFVPAFLVGFIASLFSATGEELGWRGLLVPQMSKFMTFTNLALISGAIWTAWHLPLIIFGNYHGVGPLWYSIIVFIPQTISIGLVLAWIRLKSGSVWGPALFHGSWNYFIQGFYPALTLQTEASMLITGEFGWFSPIMCVIVALVFWHYRDRLPKPKID